MRRLFIVIAIIALAPFGLARADAVTEADKSDFSRIISAQIDAFRADDGARAYSYAAPMIQQVFPTAEHFMAMVRQGYMPVYRPQSFTFGQAGLDAAGRPTQLVTIVGPDGKTYEALYTFERQPDGSWKIAGCRLLETPGLNT
ncbi:MAG: DUF4864 domain-containing protein [Aestuariivirga sp.]|jgi:ketosteroid isomerase-like protein